MLQKKKSQLLWSKGLEFISPGFELPVSFGFVMKDYPSFTLLSCVVAL